MLEENNKCYSNFNNKEERIDYLLNYVLNMEGTTTIDKLIEERTKIPTMIADDAISCVAMGTGKALNHLELLQTGNAVKIRKF